MLRFAAMLLLAGCASVHVDRDGEAVAYADSGAVVWFSPCFHALIRDGSKGCNDEPYAQQVASGIGALLAAKRVTPEQLFLAYPEPTLQAHPRKAVPRGNLLPRLKTEESELRVMKVLDLIETPSDDGRKVVIRMETTPRCCDGLGRVDFIAVEAVNPAASVTRDRTAFFRGARVVAVRYEGSMI